MSEGKLTVEQQLHELEELLAWFESDEVTVSEAIAKYERSQLLAKEIEVALLEAKNQITQIELKYKQNNHGSV